MYSFDIIVTYVIENKVRVVGPFALFYIDFEMFDEEEFYCIEEVAECRISI